MSQDLIKAIRAAVIENNDNRFHADYVPKTFIITTELIKRLFEENDCTVVKAPYHCSPSSSIIFYRNTKPSQTVNHTF